MDLRQLEILQAIAETGSFTACGRKLHVSQSAISRQILLLEEELGEPLFLRVGRQVRMTPAAESLVQLGQRVFQDVRETVGTITDRTSELRGHASSVGWHDRLPVRVPAAAQAPPARASSPRRAADRGDRRTVVEGNPRWPDRRRSADAAGRRVRRGRRPGPARRAAAHHHADASAGAAAACRAARPRRDSRSSCSRSGRPPAG